MIADAKYQAASAAEMLAIGRKFAAELQAGEVLGLTGELGAGKTQLAKGVVAGLGCDCSVTSPTFTLIQEYHGGRLPVYHVDFYRLVSEQEAIATGVEELLPSNDGVTIVEWADKFASLLPVGTWMISISTLANDTDCRTLSIGRID